MALKAIFGSHTEQYHCARDYCEAILMSNPRSSAYMQMEGPCFQWMYVCLAACKKCFKYDCRLILSLDACHLKGKCRGSIVVCHWE